MQQKIVRAIRIIEYEGEESWVNGCLNNPNSIVAPGRDFIAGNNGIIRELSGRGVKVVAKVVTKLEFPVANVEASNG